MSQISWLGVELLHIIVNKPSKSLPEDLSIMYCESCTGTLTSSKSRERKKICHDLGLYAIVNFMFILSDRSRNVLQILCGVSGFTAGFWFWQVTVTYLRTSSSTRSRVRAIQRPARVSSASRASGTTRTTGSTCRTAASAVRSVCVDF